MKRVAAFWAEQGTAFRRKPVSTALTIVAVVVLVRVVGEFAAGFWDGLMIGFRDPH